MFSSLYYMDENDEVHRVKVEADLRRAEQNRIIGYDKLDANENILGIPLLVSTIFLMVDRNFGGDEPILFETMIFGDSEGGWLALDSVFMTRHKTAKEARIAHAYLVIGLRYGSERLEGNDIVPQEILDAIQAVEED